MEWMNLMVLLQLLYIWCQMTVVLPLIFLFTYLQATFFVNRFMTALKLHPTKYEEIKVIENFLAILHSATDDFFYEARTADTIF